MAKAVETFGNLDYTCGVYDLFIRARGRNTVRRTSTHLSDVLAGIVQYHQGEVERGRETHLRMTFNGHPAEPEVELVQELVQMHNDYVDLKKAAELQGEMIRQRAS